MASKLLSMIGFGNNAQNQTPCDELPEVYPFLIGKNKFIEIDLKTIFVGILTDVVERTFGLPEKYEHTLWDSCLKSAKSEGLITMLAKAMRDKADIFLVYDRPTGVLRYATSEEQRQIREDYEKKSESNIGIYVSFTDYDISDMMKIYGALEYYTIGSFYKSMNLSSALLIKIDKLRESIASLDSEEAIRQARAIAEALNNGRPSLIDSKDIIELPKVDIEPTNKSDEFIAKKRSLYLGLPAAYITGLISGTLSDTGEADARAVERGLKRYFVSIVKPVLEDLFKIKVSFKSDNNYNLTTALTALKDFELTSEEFLSSENKLKILNKLFDLPENAKGDETPDQDKKEVPDDEDAETETQA